jgi:hypothetical protein
VARNTASLLLFSLALVAACSQKPQPVTGAKPAPSAPAPSTAAAPPTAPAEPAPAKPEPSRDGKVVVVDPGDDPAHHPKTLVEAAREERERRAHAGEPVAVITNKTLPHSKGQMTYAQPGAKPAGEKAIAAEADKAKEKGEARGETYWRQRGLEIRQRWHRAADEVAKLEQSVADWRRRFYSEDDPAVRDAQVKPEWDRALDRLQHQKEEVLATQRELDGFLEEGRRAGALPGWLREGNDLEPAPPPPPPSPTEAIEPPQLPDGPP